MSGDGRKPPRIRVKQDTKGRHIEDKPKVRERETKRRVGPLMRAAMAAVASLTEGLDLLFALFGALPQYRQDECKARNGGFAGPLETAQCLYEWADEIDPYMALVLVALNELQDRLIGLGARQRQEVWKSIGRDAGLPDAQQWASRMAREHGAAPPEVARDLADWLRDNEREHAGAAQEALNRIREAARQRAAS